MATVGTLLINLKANTSQFGRGMHKANKQLSLMRRNAARAAGALKAFGVGLGAYAVISGIRSMVRETAEFSKQMAMVSTMLDKQTMRFMPQYRRAIEKMSVQFAQSTDTLTKGLYDILSAGTKASDALYVLAEASRAAVAGMTDTGTATRVITALLNTYADSGGNARKVSDRLFAAVQKGVFTFGDLAANIGKVAPMARAAGMSMEQMLGTVAALTKQGLSAEEATTRLNAILVKFPKAGRNIVELARQFRGMDLAQIMKLVPERRAAAGLAALASDVEGLADAIAAIERAAGSTEEAFEKMAQSMAYQFKQAESAWTRFKRGAGMFFISLVRAPIKGIQKLAGGRDARAGLRLLTGLPPLPPSPGPTAEEMRKAPRIRFPEPPISEAAKRTMLELKALAEMRQGQAEFMREAKARLGMVHLQNLLKLFTEGPSAVAKAVGNAVRQMRQMGLEKLRQQGEAFWDSMQTGAERYESELDFINKLFGLGAINLHRYVEMTNRLTKAFVVGKPSTPRRAAPQEAGMISSRYMEIRGLAGAQPQVREQQKTNEILTRIEHKLEPTAIAG